MPIIPTIPVPPGRVPTVSRPATWKGEPSAFKCAGVTESGTGLFSLFGVRPRTLPPGTRRSVWRRLPARPEVQRMIASVGAAVSLEEGSTVLRELAGVEVNAKQVERVAESLGAEIASGSGRRPIPSPTPSPLQLCM